MLFRNLQSPFALLLLILTFLPYNKIFCENNAVVHTAGFRRLPAMADPFDLRNLGTSTADTTRDHLATGTPLPSAIRLEMPVPGDQGTQRSCGAWAIVYGAGSYYMHLVTGEPYSNSTILSPGFIYNQLPKGTQGITSLKDNFEWFRKVGACSLKMMPYNSGDCSTQPDSAQRRNASNRKIKDWQKINPYDLALVKATIAQKKPVIFSIVIDEGFNKITAPFIWNARCGSPGQTHTMVITGYDDTKNAFLVMNSWGTSWGNDGFVWIDYQFFLHNALPGGYILI